MAKQTKYGYFVYRTYNIGDDIQTLAAEQFLPSLDIPVDRDQISKTQEACKLICNSWYMHNSANNLLLKRRARSHLWFFDWPPPAHIDTLLISMHFNSKFHMMSKKAVAYYKENGPVGCRDFQTKRWLEKRGVPCYFSGCLTLTLPKIEAEKNSNIYFVDVGRGKDEVSRKLADSLGKEPIYMSHITTDMSADFKRKKAREVLKTYAAAKLVVTTRLHCALPCLAMGTPVIFIINSRKGPRFDGLAQYTHNYTYQEVMEGKFDIDWENPRPNPTEHLPVAEKLRERVKEFIQAE